MSAGVSQELKGLQTRLARCSAELDTAVEETRRAQRRESELRREKTNLAEKVKSLQESTEEPIVSEHALLRYIERVYNIDMDEIRKEILSPTVLTLVKTLGKNGRVPLEKGGRAVFKDGVVVTIEI